MIATRDNSLSYRATENSLKISKDSREIAIVARQDSTDMRVIAIATLTFLPATFVAVSLASPHCKADLEISKCSAIDFV